MIPENELIDFELLVTRYLSGEATAQEVELLEGIVRSDEQKRLLFFRYKQAWRIAMYDIPSGNREKAWDLVKTRIDFPCTTQKPLRLVSRPLMLVLRVAAIVLLLAGFGITLQYLLQTRTNVVMAVQNVESLLLDDGTTISLNKNSSIEYPSRFRGEERRVKLTGDAYFHVTPGKTFIVETEHVEVVVLGTSFYVNAREDHPDVEVIVSSGKVAMKLPDKDPLVLTANNKGVYNKEKSTLIVDEDIDRNYLSWKTKEIVFDDDGLDVVASVIEKTYSIKVLLADPELANCRLTATFIDLPLDDVISIVCETFGIEAEKLGDTIKFSGLPCK